MANYTQGCPEGIHKHQYHGSFSEGGFDFDVYTYGPARNLCVRHGNEPWEYAGHSPLEHVMNNNPFIFDPVVRGALQVVVNNCEEVRQITRARRRKLWQWACEHDGIDPASKFVIFSDDNPFIGEHDALGD
jgi:hypothetical protein